MENPSIIVDGRKIDVRKMDEMYTTTINGHTFISETFKNLVSAIGSLYSVKVTEDCIVPQISQVEKLKGLLSDASLLADRQEALKQLESLSDPEAVGIVDRIKSKPVSFNASYITRVLCKKHFSEVSQVEISDLVTNIIDRSKLLKELSDIVK